MEPASLSVQPTTREVNEATRARSRGAAAAATQLTCATVHSLRPGSEIAPRRLCLEVGTQRGAHRSHDCVSWLDGPCGEGPHAPRGIR